MSTTTSTTGRADSPSSFVKRRAQRPLDAAHPVVPPLNEPPREPLGETPDLAASGANLAPAFPLDESGTGVVLYVASAGRMRVHWSLERDDFEQAAASFPVNGQRPAAVLRLRRDRAGGGTDLVDERPLGAGTRDGAGEAVFSLPRDHGLYRAELGLTDGGGGWLMLARSNGHYNAVGVGLDVPASPAESPEDAQPASAPESLTAGAAGQAPVQSDAIGPGDPDGEPALGAGPSELVAASFPVVTALRSLLAASVHAADAVPGAGSSTGGGDGAARVQYSCADGGGLVALPAVAAMGAAPIQSLVETLAALPATRLQGAIGARQPAGGPGLAAGGAGRQDGQEPEGRGAEGPEPGGVLPGINVRIEPLTYERPAARATGVELDAELRILGRAEPNSTIDLLGFPYRVGPGGRFLLVLRVEDPALLRRALEGAPPPELSTRRDP